MIRILASTSGLAERIRRVVDGVVQIVDAASELLADDSRIDCMIVSCRSRLLPERIELLREIERKLPLVPVILVTDREMSVARWLSGVKVFALVWFDDVQTQLQPRIEEARHTGALSQLAEVIRRSALPPALRAGLVHSLRAARSLPVRNLGELARAVRRSPATLSQQFRTRALEETTLSRFLGGLVLLRAHQLRLSGRTWEYVSGQLGFTRATLNRKCRKWPGCTLSELELLDPDLLLASFVSEYVQPWLENAGLKAMPQRSRSGRPLPP